LTILAASSCILYWYAVVALHKLPINVFSISPSATLLTVGLIRSWTVLLLNLFIITACNVWRWELSNRTEGVSMLDYSAFQKYFQ